ncbi:low molecular weight protein-tyrosine-phosphatase [Sphingorhabdus sp. SMR4y]|uniref:low molecular weight protein-tyrosine-phosphatase n=1 Tax=Sphingorhabdus sp. SMR4y TaxID=2584094 RepID=UPI000B5C94DF|nr:low molecular weight protein-tyrosine-phosphatase [Sphingorhabdus sp. SMR4y]ASK87224.1 low molecular weight protein-tyrosine-phosphatase YfkJ [Sphingorhabdus sp. SMR4y]
MNPSILFVCLGNICRSPLAEAALRQECMDSTLNIIVDSAGTGDWHAGQPPDERAQAVAAQNGVDIGHLRARQVKASDFRDFDHIIALDNQNLRDLKALRPAMAVSQLSLLFDHVAGRAGEDVADPYYGAARDFEQTWAEVSEAARNIRKWLEAG